MSELARVDDELQRRGFTHSLAYTWVRNVPSGLSIAVTRISDEYWHLSTSIAGAFGRAATSFGNRRTFTDDRDLLRHLDELLAIVAPAAPAESPAGGTMIELLESTSGVGAQSVWVNSRHIVMVRRRKGPSGADRYGTEVVTVAGIVHVADTVQTVLDAMNADVTT